MTPSNRCAEGQWLSAGLALSPGLSMGVTPHSPASVHGCEGRGPGAGSSAPSAWCLFRRRCRRVVDTHLFRGSHRPAQPLVNCLALPAQHQGPAPHREPLGVSPHCLWCPRLAPRTSGTRLFIQGLPTGLNLFFFNRQLSTRHTHQMVMYAPVRF